MSARNGYLENTDLFTISTSCGPASNVISPDSAQTNLQQFESSTAVPEFLISSITLSQPACPVVSLEIYNTQDGSGVSPPATMYQGTLTAEPYKVFSSTTVIGVYSFYIKVNLEGGQSEWLSNTGATPEMFQL